jgi:hypothetical protein
MLYRKRPLSLAALLLFLFSTVTPAPTFAASVAAAEQREETAENYVGQALHVWQERLNLTNWDIHVQLVRPKALEPKTLGNIHWDLNSRQATIDVLSAYDYKLPLPEMLNDMEFTVVHELVHLHLASLPRSSATRMKEEYAVNQLARALLNLAKH